MGIKIHVKVPATAANLGAGLDCFGVAVDLWNELIVEEACVEEICIRGEGEDDLPRDSQNLVVTSFKFFLSKVEGVDVVLLPKFKFVCTNNIPVARGLGSSTAAVVAGLLAAAALGAHLQTRESDVPSEATMASQQPFNSLAISASADAAAYSLVSTPAVAPTHRDSRASAMPGKEAIGSCRRDNSNKDLAAGDISCGHRAAPPEFTHLSSTTVPRTSSAMQVFKVIDGNSLRLRRTLNVGEDLGCLSVLLQMASEIEGHADNAAPAIYGGLCLALAWQCPDDEEIRHDTDHKKRVWNWPTLTPGQGLPARNEVGGCTSGEDSSETCVPEKIVADVSAQSTETRDLCAEDRRGLSLAGYEDGIAHGGIPQLPVPIQPVSSESTETRPLPQGHGNLTESNEGPCPKKWVASKILTPPGLKLVFFIPTDRMLTKTAREALPRVVQLEDAIYNVSRSALFVHCLTASAAASAADAAARRSSCDDVNCISVKVKPHSLGAAVAVSRCMGAAAAGDESSTAEAAEAMLFPMLREAMNDKLHQPYRRALNSHLEPLIASANQAGALGTALSGAGPSVVAFCMARRANDVASALKRAAEQIRKSGRVLVTEPSAEGAHIVDLLLAAGKNSVRQ